MNLNDSRLWIALALAYLFLMPREARADEPSDSDPDDFGGYGGGGFGGGGAGSSW